MSLMEILLAVVVVELFFIGWGLGQINVKTSGHPRDADNLQDSLRDMQLGIVNQLVSLNATARDILWELKPNSEKYD